MNLIGSLQIKKYMLHYCWTNKPSQLE